MPETETAKKGILPPNCEDVRKQHRWVRVTVHGCGAGSGDHAIDEAMVFSTFTPIPEKDCVCNDCFQKFGALKGIRDNTLAAVYKAISVW